MADANRSLACRIFYMSRQWGHRLPGLFVVVVVLITAQPRLWRHPSTSSMIMADSQDADMCSETSLYSFIFQLRALRATYSMELKQESEFIQSMANVNINSQNVAHNAIWLLGSALKPARNVHFLHAIFKKTAIFHPITSIFYIPSGQSQMVWNLTT